ncbi:hypothetical protein TWF106_007424 [Orbilia oligospora]|uniref:Uncharacterized protein n=1 Tax=Orbilia oligospora TaxID=2813651 RepID=A0A7C8UUI6_ORBOL|nr:hypothetical protein TWF106_007424 [Orbilia oligospora]
MTTRLNRPNWFKSWNYIMDARPLTTYLPNTCYATNTKYGDGYIQSFTVRNNIDQPTITGVALYHSDDCGKGFGKFAYKFLEVPFMIIKFDAFDPYGINTVDLMKFGVRWLTGSWRSVDIEKEHGDGGLLAGIPDYGESGVVIWEGDPEVREVPLRRVWIPDSVVKVREGRDFMEKLPPPPDRRRYVYLRDLVERVLMPGSEDIPDVVTEYFDELVKKLPPVEDDDGAPRQQVERTEEKKKKKKVKTGNKLLKGPLHNPSDPKSNFSYETHRESYKPVYDSVSRQFPTLPQDIIPDAVYYEGLGSIDGRKVVVVEEVPQRMEIIEQIKPDREVLDDRDFMIMEGIEQELEEAIEDTNINQEFQRFLSDEEEPNDSEISQLLETGSREDSRPLGELWADKRPIAELGEQVRESITLEENFPNGEQIRSPAHNMQVEEEPQAGTQENQANEEDTNGLIAQQEERRNEEEERGEEILNQMEEEGQPPNDDTSQSSLSVSDWQRLRTSLQAFQPLQSELLNRQNRLLQQEAEVEEQRLQRGNMMAPMIYNNNNNNNNLEQEARPDRAELSLGGMMDMSARLRTLQNPFEYDRTPFASTSSQRRRFQIPPLRRESMEDLIESSFSSTNRRPRRQSIEDNRIVEEVPGPQNSPDN